ncbi:sigma factor binding protein 1, chloroplastic [Ricinus communis]|uniref:VQ domain-containing protein n=1 Tax=Ricinus communis TaxID=3988 RepID=B9RG77_RICCO|nr:sigma factor binding protein 1, chloroplastic [Ricinus communis]EEF49532.1 protein with unknown function [Ricinus communis]|eukprot:XP_002513029.1 sigma factor binding protein 1, chloroplastic [Ricinus communis]
MDVLGVNMKSRKQASKRSKKGIKVVYISSPMKVETSASKFRALVQELTGKDSDAARFMDVNNGAENYSTETTPDRSRAASDEHGSVLLPLMSSYNEPSFSSSPDSDSSIFDPFDRFLPPMEGSFMSMFQSNFPHESFQLDVFN